MSDATIDNILKNTSPMITDVLTNTYISNDETNAATKDNNDNNCDYKVDGDDDNDDVNDFDESHNDVGDERIMCLKEIKYHYAKLSFVSPKLVCRDCFCYVDEVGDNDSDLLLRCGCLIHYDCMIRYIKSQLGDKDMIFTIYNKYKSFLLDKHYIICPYYNAGLCNANSMIKSFISIDDLHQIMRLHSNNNIEDNYLIQSDINNNLCIYQSDIDKLIEWIQEYNSKLLLNSQKAIPLIDQSDYQNDAYIEATTKKCPTCNVRGTHYHGHMCHHISPMGGCSNCHTHYCYRCLSTEQDNLLIRHNRSSCLCGHWSSFCSPLTDRSEAKKYLVKSPYPYDKRCGCSICPDCSVNKPCSTCPGDCVVCLVSALMMIIVI